MTDNTAKKNILLLTAIVLILLVASGTATYAWFSTSSKLDIQGVSFYAKVNDKLKISVDAKEWGSSVKGSDFTFDISSMKNVYPATYLGYNLFDAENAPFKKLINNESTDKGVSYYVSPDQFTNAKENVGYFVAPIYLQCSRSMDIYLDENSYIMPYSTVEDDKFSKDYIAGAARVGIFNENGQPIVVWAPNACFKISNYNNGKAVITNDNKDVNHNKATYVEGKEYNFVSTIGSTLGEHYLLWPELEPSTTLLLYIVYWVEGEDSEAISPFSGGQMVFNISFRGIPIQTE